MNAKVLQLWNDLDLKKITMREHKCKLFGVVLQRRHLAKTLPVGYQESRFGFVLLSINTCAHQRTLCSVVHTRTQFRAVRQLIQGLSLETHNIQIQFSHVRF